MKLGTVNASGKFFKEVKTSGEIFLMIKNSVSIISAILLLTFFAVTPSFFAQSGVPATVIQEGKSLKALQDEYKSGSGTNYAALTEFIVASEKLLGMKPLSVMDKSVELPGFDKHDFVSVGPYWWPDPSKPDGLPYIRRDGERNPEYYNITDERYFTSTVTAAESLAVAYYITGADAFASKAAQLLRVWFLNDETKMNPNMKHAQMISGRNDGRGIGLIETRQIYKALDAAILLRNSEAWSAGDNEKMNEWFGEYFGWITTHQYGIDESNEENNHGTWYDVQASAIALFLGKNEFAENIFEEAKLKRIDAQIEADGRQPLELARTKSWNYSCMNLSAFMHLAVLAEHSNVDLWNYVSPKGGSIRKALDYLLPFGLDHSKWEYKQIEEMNNESLYSLLLAASEKYNKEYYDGWIEKIFGKEKSIDISMLVFVF